MHVCLGLCTCLRVQLPLFLPSLRGHFFAISCSRWPSGYIYFRLKWRDWKQPERYFATSFFFSFFLFSSWTFFLSFSSFSFSYFFHTLSGYRLLGKGSAEYFLWCFDALLFLLPLYPIFISLKPIHLSTDNPIASSASARSREGGY